jgi:hypothetical protein
VTRDWNRAPRSEQTSIPIRKILQVARGGTRSRDIVVEVLVRDERHGVVGELGVRDRTAARVRSLAVAAQVGR